ncbi:unnamed protein product [Polarella glacialis]|uniref:Pentatricopeptide repeat-containing protein n=1 Tax=Polarella glacialis TaxID=89957 RepID=A0A813IDG7_POLGL|nr:unnamed protein product [Polarella glacialis]
MHRRVNLDVVCCNTLLDAFQKASEWERAVHFFHEMPWRGVPPSADSRRLLAACLLQGREEVLPKLRPVSPHISSQSVMECLLAESWAADLKPGGVADGHASAALDRAFYRKVQLPLCLSLVFQGTLPSGGYLPSLPARAAASAFEHFRWRCQARLSPGRARRTRCRN